MGVLRFVLRNLMRNKRRTILTVLSLAVSIFIVNTLVSVLRGFAATDVDTGASRRLITRNKVSLTQWIPESYWAKIRQVPHVVAVTPWSWFGGVYKDEASDFSNFFARFSLDPDQYLEVTKGDRTTSAEEIRAWKEDRTGALVGRNLLKRQGWKLGDKITIRGDIYPVDLELTLRGTFGATIKEDENAVYFHHQYLEELTGRPGRVGTYWLRVDAPENMPGVARAIDALFANSEAETLTETEAQFSADFVSMMGNVRGLITMLSLVVAVAILMVSANTMAMAVRERTTEIAVMKAIGFSPARVLAEIVLESCALAGVAWATACVLSFLVFNLTGFKLPMLFWPMGLTPGSAAIAGGVALAIGLVSGLLPGIVAARTSVVDGLRKVA